MAMEKEPDFIGNFMLPEDGEQQKLRKAKGDVSRELYLHLAGSDEGVFYMFIENRKKEGNLEKIFGKIEDKVGVANFEGELGSDFIKFTKKYYEEHLPGAMPEMEIFYEGNLNSEGIFRGKYLFKGVEGCGMFILYPVKLYLNESLGFQKN